MRTVTSRSATWVARDLVASVLLATSLAACSGATQAPASAAAASSDPTANAPSPTMAPVTVPPATAAGPARCAVTPDASPAAEIGTFADGLPDFDGEATIKVGEAVAFVSGGDGPHTVTEGYYGEVAPNPCVDEGLPNNATLTVTFTEPGVYQIACRPHPVMQTTVTVE